jgi:hypothetical protein
LILITSAFLATLFLALTICRVAALSDDSHAVAVTEWIAATYLAESDAAPAEGPPAERQPSKAPRGAYRRAG